MDNYNNRPRFLNLVKISMPVTAVVSIAHRISGMLLVVGIPFFIYAFQMSVSSVEQYARLIAVLQYPLMKVIGIILVWSFIHHLFAGIRFLLIDMDIGVSRKGARIGAWLVHVTALGVTGVLAGVIL